MSFKSKQRAKHGHLFGDDPLNAALVSASDDPLFAPSKTSQSSRTNSPATSYPLSRNSRPASPLDASSSTPISPRCSTHAKTNNSSIFGDIDVSKLGGGNTGNGNGLYNNGSSKRVSTTSLRSTTTLRSNRQFDEDEEDLFGGGRVLRTRVLSKATSPTPFSTSSTSINRKSPPIVHNPLPAAEPQQPTIPTPRKATPPPSPPTIVQPTPVTPPKVNSSNSSTHEDTKSVATVTAPAAEERPSSSSSFFASASRFFKSSSNTNSKTSSSASSIASVNNVPSPKLQQQEELPNPPLPPPRQPQQQQQQQPQQQKPRQIPIQQPIIDNTEQEEDEEEEQVTQHVIEDEATRAFADDVISFQPTSYQPDYAAISPDLSILASIDSLRLDNTGNKRLLPSASTPTTLKADMDDPWFDGAMLSTTSQRILPILGNIEPSVSSPLQQHREHKISIQDIEPQKRTAFADLITSWNTGQTNNNIYETVHKEDPEQFFSHVAEEQRDIGFAGIAGDDDSDNNRHVSSSVVDVWDNTEENPWN